MASLISEYIQFLSKNVYPGNFEKTLNCFEALTEFIQGPCSEN